MRLFLLCVFAASAALLGGRAFATDVLSEPLDHAPSVVVHFADLDITHEEGARVLLDRIHYAARKACGPEPEFGNLYMMGKWDDCVKDAETRAIAHLNRPLLNRLAGIGLHAPSAVASAN